MNMNMDPQFKVLFYFCYRILSQKPIREKGIYFSLHFQIIALHDGKDKTETSVSHSTSTDSRKKSMCSHAPACLTACFHSDFSILI